MTTAIKAVQGWWHSRYEDSVCSGPFATRDEAISAAVADGGYASEEDGREVHRFWICEARNEPLRLADWISADTLLERADESVIESDRACSEFDDGLFFEATPEQDADLAKRIKAACDEWQAAHGLTFTCNTFSHVWNQEQVTHVTSPEGGVA